MPTTFRSRRRSIAALLIATSALASACSQISSPTYDVANVGCVAASDGTLATLSSKLTVPGTLRNGRAVEGDDGTRFITAELHTRDADPHDKGDLLTFGSLGNADEFVAVDAKAREDSSWPPGRVDVRAHGARESRACTNLVRGKTKAQLECEQQSSGGIPVPGGKNCSDL